MEFEKKVYLRCTNRRCKDGNVKKKYKEFEEIEGAPVLIDKIETQRIEYTFFEEHFKGRTIDQLVSELTCRRCRSKKLVIV